MKIYTYNASASSGVGEETGTERSNETTKVVKTNDQALLGSLRFIVSTVILALKSRKDKGKGEFQGGTHIRIFEAGFETGRANDSAHNTLIIYIWSENNYRDKI